MIPPQAVATDPHVTHPQPAPFEWITSSVTFASSAVAFLGTVGHALQSVFYGLAALGAFMGGAASLGNLWLRYQRER